MGVTHCNLKTILNGSGRYHQIRWSVEYFDENIVFQVAGRFVRKSTPRPPLPRKPKSPEHPARGLFFS
jgi:hypothetical protein